MSKDLQRSRSVGESRARRGARSRPRRGSLEGEARVKYVTDYSVMMAQTLFDLWKQMDEYLLVKYIDGNVKGDETGKILDNGNAAISRRNLPGYDEK